MDDGVRQDIIRRAVIENAALWVQAEGRRVRHGTFGKGTIVKIRAQGKHPEGFVVRFDHVTDGKAERGFQLHALFEPRFFPERHEFPQSLEHIFVRAREAMAAEEERLRYEASLAEQHRQRAAAAQEAAVRETKAIAEHISRVIDRARTGGRLDTAELEILRERGEHGLIASCYEREYERTRNIWSLIKASGAWRDDDKPHAALAATECLVPQAGKMAPKLASALLTTRGGVYRDMKDFDAAEKCAREAISLNNTNRQPYNLLAAILIQQGNTTEGEKCIARAEQLGASKHEQQRTIEQALRSLDEQTRALRIKTLRQLNPQRNAWISQGFGSR